MSLAVKCDRCGQLIDGPASNKEDFDAAVLVCGEPVLEYEDLCQSCMRRLRSALNMFKSDVSDKTDRHVFRDAADEPQESKEHVAEDDSAAVQATEPKMQKAPGFEAYAERSEEDLANATVKSFPVPKRERN